MQKLEINSRGIKFLSFSDFNNLDGDFLKKKYKFHELDIEDCLEEQSERPKIDEYSKYLFIVLQIPYFDKKDEMVEVSEVNIFVGQNYFVINHEGDLSFIKNLEKELQTVKGKKEYMSNGTGYMLYKVIEGLFDSRFKILDRLQKSMRMIERDIFRSNETKDRLVDIMKLKKSIITFRRTISPQRSVVSQLEHKNKKFMKEDLEVYFDDIVDAIETIWQNLEIMKETVDTLESTNENLISHYTNNTMRVLTIISVTMLPLTFITGLYGMNIGLPFENDPQAFKYVFGGMVALITIMLLIFWKKKWL